MKKHFDKHLARVLLAVVLLLLSSSADAQNKHRTTNASRNRTATAVGKQPKRPAAPTPLDVRERTIEDLLFFPFACIDAKLNTREEAQQQLTSTFGTVETVNFYPGLHICGTYDYTYQGASIGLAFYDYQDDRMWYLFYFDSKAEAERFSSLLANDIKRAGIPLVRDKIYGGLSNRTRPISIFKWVFVNPITQVKEADQSNINGPDVVGMYVVEFGVYKRTPR